VKAFGALGLLFVLTASAANAKEPSEAEQPALANAKPRLLVLPLTEPGLEPEGGSLAASAELALQRSSRFEPLLLRDLLDPEGTKVRRAYEEEGNGDLRAAQLSLDQLDSKQSALQADSAIAALEHADLIRSFPKLLRARVIKLASQVANGETRAVHQGLENLINLQPRVELPTNYFTPEDLARAAQIRREVGRGGTGRLEVQTAPPGASVYLDGQFRGVAPMTVMGLTSVDHLLTVTAPGYVLEQEKARRGTASIALKPAEGLPRYQALLDRLRKATTQKERFEQARAFAEGLGADQVLILSTRADLNPGKAAVTLVRLDTHRGQSFGYQQFLVDQNEPAGIRAERPLHGLLSEDTVGASLPPEPLTASSAATSSGFFSLGHVLLGAGGLLLIGGVSTGIAALESQHQYSQINTLGAAAAHPYQVRGQHEAVISDILNAAGLVTLGIGGYLTWSEAQTPSGTLVSPTPPSNTLGER
jgi:hypothetical protein